MEIAQFHLPGLFEYTELYKRFLPLFFNNREYFYDFVNIASIYGSPQDYIWSGGRMGGSDDIEESLTLMKQYNISTRLTFSNSKLQEKHFSDKKCNTLVSKLDENDGIIIHSDLLLQYLKKHYPLPFYISSTTKVILDFDKLLDEIRNDDYKYVVPDFRFNKSMKLLNNLHPSEKNKVELLVNECCFIGCNKRKECYQNVSLKMLNEEIEDFKCVAPNAQDGYVFSNAMKNESFISIDDIKEIYLPKGFSNFKIEGRSLGSALIFEMLLYYLVKPQYQLIVREQVYLDSNLDLF